MNRRGCLAPRRMRGDRHAWCMNRRQVLARGSILLTLLTAGCSGLGGQDSNQSSKGSRPKTRSTTRSQGTGQSSVGHAGLDTPHWGVPVVVRNIAKLTQSIDVTVRYQLGGYGDRYHTIFDKQVTVDPGETVRYEDAISLMDYSTIYRVIVTRPQGSETVVEFPSLEFNNGVEIRIDSDGPVGIRELEG